MRRILIPLSLTLACSGQVEEETTQTTSNGGQAVQALDPSQLPKVDCSQGTASQEAQGGLTPAPGEIQKMLNNDGISGKLKPKVKDVAKVNDKQGKDQLAVLTGVILADLVLTAEDEGTSNGQRVEMLKKIKESAISLDLGQDIPNQVDDLVNDVNSGAVSGSQLTMQFDMLNAVMVGELSNEGSEWVVPLLQAGSWLEGAHLVSGAYEGKTSFKAAEQILKAPKVVKYFQCYVQDREGDVEDGVITTLKITLAELQKIAGAKEALTAADLKTIKEQTGNVLAFLDTDPVEEE